MIFLHNGQDQTSHNVDFVSNTSEFFATKSEGQYIVIYTKPNCSKCRLTFNAIKSSDAKYSMIQLLGDDATDEEKKYFDKKLSEFKEKGFRSFPVVEVYQDGNKIDEWCDFNFQKIRKYTKKESL